MPEFILRAYIGGIGVALIAGLLGSFVVWRRMAYFSEALAHSTLLGVPLGLWLGLNLNLSALLVCLLLAVLVILIERERGRIPLDTIFGLVAHGTLAIGLLVLSFMEGVRADLMHYLFGDILAVSMSDLAFVFVGGVCLTAALWRMWRPLLLITVDEELARVEGVAVERHRWAFMLMIALVIAVGMKIVGALLMTALLIVPAAAARHIAATPERMAALAALIGCVSVVGGISGSMWWDTPSGPSIVAVALGAFLLVWLSNRLRSTRRARGGTFALRRQA
ncbi:MAG: metal ABC transporter permease [Candidatus Poribacteria bacterium]|nr:metal ABC transporter permease [Candidatus Poribacteria bacterium]